MVKRAIIGLGSNLGDREAYLQQACRLITERVGAIKRSSSVIETESWGFQAPPFKNQVIVVETALDPIALLDELQQIERELGRTQKSTVVDGQHIYHNRTIDLDILDYNHEIWHTERLTLPHPQIHHREFVLQSLKELNITL